MSQDGRQVRFAGECLIVNRVTIDIKKDLGKPPPVVQNSKFADTITGEISNVRRTTETRRP